MRAGIIATLLLLGAVTSSWAELHFAETKGLSKLIQLSDRCSYLNAIHPVLERYQGRYINIFNYAPAEGNPSADPSELLVQGLFSVPPGTDNALFLRTSPLSRKFGRFLSPTTIGKILAVIESSDPTTNHGALKQALKNAISADNDFKILTEKSKETAKAILVRRDALEVAQLMKKIKEQISEKETELNALQTKMKEPLCHEAGFSQIEDLKGDITAVDQKMANLKKQNDIEKELMELGEEEKRLSEILSKNEEYKKLTDQYNSYRYDPSFMNEFLDKLIKSLHSERSPFQGGRYPQYFTEQVLLTLALLNTPDHDKRYFLKLYGELPEHCFKEGKKPNLSDPLMGEQYAAADYDKVKTRLKKLRSQNQAIHLIQNPDDAALLRHGKRFYDLGDVPILPYKTVALKHPSEGQKFFPDCMESSILNFFSIIGKDFETDLPSGTALQATLNDKGYRLHEKIESFFNSYQDPASLDTLRAHDEWAALMSFLEGVHYKNGDYEVKSEIDNIFAVMEKLIQPNQAGVPPLFKGLSTRKEKMDKLSKILSHNEFNLSWDIEGGSRDDLDTNNHAELLFSIENIPTFKWRVRSGHSEMDAAERRIDSWEENLGRFLSNSLTSPNRTHLGYKDRSSLDYKLITLFLSGKEVPELAETLEIKASSKEYGFLQKGFALATINEKLDLAASLLVTKDPNDIEWGKRLIGSIPRTDLAAQSLVMNFIIAHGLNKAETFRNEFENAAQVLRSQPKDAVFYAVENGHLGTLQYLYAQKVPFKIHNHRLENPLHLLVARESPNIECLQFVASACPELLTQMNKLGNTPLQKAITVAKVPTAMAVWDEMDSRTMDINTPNTHTLSFAIASGKLEMMLAIAEKEDKTIRQAIEGFKHKSDQTKPLKRMNALEVLIEKKKIKFLRFLFDYEKDLFIELLSKENEESESPLKQLAKKTKADLSIPSLDTHFQFIKDLARDFPEIFSLKEIENGASLLHMMAEGDRANEVQFVLKFLGKRVNDHLFLDHHGASPLHRAAASKDFTPATEEITTALAKANPNWVKLKDKDGKTPLDLAKTPEMIQLLKKL